MSAEFSERAAEVEAIKRAQRGDGASVRDLIEANKERLHVFVWRMVRNHHDAEEICQDTFLKAFASLDSFNTRYRFSTWLFTIAYRLCLNHLRRKRSLTGEMDFGGVSGSSPDVSETLAASEEAARLKAVVWEAVEELSVPQKAAVLLFYRQEQSCSEIAQVLQVPVATVKSHLHRARARLKEILEPSIAGDLSRLRILSETAG